MQILSDLALARRLERAEGTANASFVAARAKLAPESGAAWVEVAGAYAMFDGIRSPLTQTFGLGLYEMPADEDMERIEGFFRERGAPVFHEVSPLSGKDLLKVLNDRGYRPVEFTSVLYLPLLGNAPAFADRSPAITVRLVGADEQEVWSRTAAEGWREFTELTDLVADMLNVTAVKEDNLSFLAELDGQPIAAGALAIHGGVALLAGASTIPEWRNRGAQRALLASRLEYAVRAGCDLAMIGAEPGSASQRNAERQGFRIAYTRVKWGLQGS